MLFLWRQGVLSKGLFVSALPLASFFILTGAYRFYRSLKRYRLAQDEFSGPTFLISEELPHLEGRRQRFTQKRKVDSIGLLIGFTLIGLCIVFEWNHILLGTSVSITVFSSVLLVFDLFGQFRTEEFIHHLNKIKT